MNKTHVLFFFLWKMFWFNRRQLVRIEIATLRGQKGNKNFMKWEKINQKSLLLLANGRRSRITSRWSMTLLTTHNYSKLVSFSSPSYSSPLFPFSHRLANVAYIIVQTWCIKMAAHRFCLRSCLIVLAVVVVQASKTLQEVTTNLELPFKRNGISVNVEGNKA